MSGCHSQDFKTSPFVRNFGIMVPGGSRFKLKHLLRESLYIGPYIDLKASSEPSLSLHLFSSESWTIPPKIKEFDPSNWKWLNLWYYLYLFCRGKWRVPSFSSSKILVSVAHDLLGFLELQDGSPMLPLVSWWVSQLPVNCGMDPSSLPG